MYSEPSSITATHCTCYSRRTSYLATASSYVYGWALTAVLLGHVKQPSCQHHDPTAWTICMRESCVESPCSTTSLHLGFRSRVCVRAGKQQQGPGACFVCSSLIVRFVSAYWATVYGAFKHAAAQLLYIAGTGILPALQMVGNDARTVSIARQKQPRSRGIYPPEHAYLDRQAAHVASRYEQS